MMDKAQNRVAMTELGRSLVAGAAGAATVIGIGLYGSLPAPATAYAALIGGMIYTGLVMSIPRRLSLRERLEASGELTGMQAHEVERFVSDSRATIQRIRDCMDGIPDHRELIESIVVWAERIVANAQDDPSDIGRSGKFEIHLRESAMIVEKVVSLRKKDQGIESQVIADIEGKALVVLRDINDAFEKRYQSNLENNIRDVEVDLQVLKGALDREGL